MSEDHAGGVVAASNEVGLGLYAEPTSPDEAGVFEAVLVRADVV